MELIFITLFVFALQVLGLITWIVEFSLPENSRNDQKRIRLRIISFILLGSATLGMLALISLGVVIGMFGLILSFALLVTNIEAEFRTAGVRNRAWQAEFLWVLAIAVKSGRPLADEIEAYAASLPGKRQNKLKDMAIRLRHGDQLPDVVEMQGLLPRSAVMQIYSGISAKSLQESLGNTAIRVTQDLAEDQEAGPKGIALIYPASLMTMVCLICSFIMYWIIPKFKKIFDDFGTELPRMTILLIKVSDTIVNYWYLFLLPFFYVPIAAFMLVMYTEYYGWRDVLRYLFGSRWISLYTPEILRTLAKGVEYNQSIEESLSNVIKRPLPEKPRRTLSAALNSMTMGASCWQSLQKAKLINLQEAALLETFQKAGNLPWALETLATTIENRRYFKLRAIFEIVQPAMLILVAMTVGFVVISLFMPLIKLLNDLS